MAAYKCKMCGGDLMIEAGSSVCECEYCGSRQTVPTADNEKKMTQFTRAGKLLRGCDFDKAAGVFESIVADFPDEAEAYWGLVLCNYGIEYVDDPATGKKIPTCHRSSFESVLDDENYAQACENADTTAHRLYREEARAIEKLRKDIIEVSGREEPYDVFISYKETDEFGDRTLDSVIAQDIYNELTREGYRVFFSRISLEDKLGTEYEPYIFAALNSAKVMLVVGTDFDHMNAVWVKNEWSRFLKLIAAGQRKTLVPCYKNMDPYDMPREFAKLTAQDMGKIGAMQDLLRGVEKLLGGKKEAPKQETVVVQQVMNDNTAALLERGFMALEDCEWQKADSFFEEALNQNAKCAEAYLGKLMAEKKVSKREQLADLPYPFEQSKNYEKLMRFGDDALKTEVQGYIDTIIARNNNAIYDNAQSMMDAAETSVEYEAAARKFGEIPGWKDADAKTAECLKLAKNVVYDAAQALMDAAKTEEAYKKAAQKFGEIPGWRDADTKAAECLVLGERAFIALKGRMAYTREVMQKSCVSVSCGGSHTAGLRSDGTVVAVGWNNKGQCNVSGWRDIVSVSCGHSHTVGLRSDGSVVAVGDNADGRCNVSGWTDIVAIACGAYRTVGLRSDGSVVAARDNVSGWTDIVSVSCGLSHTVGLRSDGSVVAVGYNKDGQCNVSDWRDIVAIACGDYHTVGLRSDGSVVAVGWNSSGQCDVSDWRDIVSVSCGAWHTVGLRSDGSVVAVGRNDGGQCDVSGWRDIVAIACGSNHTVGLRSDGSLVAVGSNGYGQCDVGDWKLFGSVETLEAEREEGRRKAEEERIAEERRKEEERRKAEEERIAEERRKEEERKRAEEARLARIAELTAKKQQLQAELANTKGLFAGGKRKKLEAEIAAIDAQLKKLEK